MGSIAAIDKMIAARKKQGGAADVDLQPLIDERNFLKSNEGLLNHVQGLTMIAKGLGESTFLTAQGFSALQNQAVASVAALEKALGPGRTAVDAHNEALKRSAPLLQEIVNSSIRRGVTLDAETQALVDNAAAQGLVNKAGTGLETVMGRVADSVQTLATVLAGAFGFKIPSALGKTEAAARDAEAAIRRIGSVKLPSSLAGRFEAEEIPGRAAGGPVEAGRPYWVGERGRELIVPRSAGTVIPHGQSTSSQQISVRASVDGPVTLVIDGKEFQAHLYSEAEKGLREGTIKNVSREEV